MNLLNLNCTIQTIVQWVTKQAVVMPARRYLKVSDQITNIPPLPEGYWFESNPRSNRFICPLFTDSYVIVSSLHQ
jgi:hypothetical protein